MSLPLPARAYLGTVVLGSMAVATAATLAWHGPLTPVDASPLTVWGLPLLLIVLASTAKHFPLEVMPGYKLNVATALYFAALLTLGLPIALATIAIAEAVGQFTLLVRPALSHGRKMGSPNTALFNTAQHTIAFGLAGLVLYARAPQVIPLPIQRGELLLLLLPLTAVTAYLASQVLVAGMVVLHRKRSLAEVLLASWRAGALQSAGLFLLGTATALLASTVWWAPLLIVVPLTIAYTALRRSAQTIVAGQTVSAVEALADVVDTRDPYTFQHSRRVAAYSETIAKRLGLPAAEVATIRLAARVHDLGKLGVPDAVLLKPGALTPAEREQMEAHPTIGFDLLKGFSEFSRVGEMVLAHHERYDGSGYPQGNAHDQLSLGGMIIAAADAYDAMTSDRPYRKALSLQIVTAEFTKHRGTQFHPQVTDVLLEMVAEKQAAQAAEKAAQVAAAEGAPVALPLAMPVAA